MKKILLILPAILISSSLFSQEAPDPEFGVVGGVNFSSVLDIDCSLKPGFYGGIYGELFDVNTGIVLRSELTYSGQGAKNAEGTISSPTKEIASSIDLDYINLAILLKIYLDRPQTLSIDAGPLIGYCIRRDIKYAKGAGSSGIEMENDNFNFSAIIGLSYKLSSRFSISARYNYGFSRAGEITQTYFPSLFQSSSKKYDFRNSVLQAGLSYRIK